jgi:hypothetical protein
MRWFSRKVTVTLIDEAKGAPFAVSEMAPADLPESFEIQTTLHLGDTDWSVIHAEPRTRAEYSKSGSLTLRLRRVEKMDPRNILFSLPSICDRLAAIGNEPLSGDECLLAEDDWRQVELASREWVSESDAEIEAIRRIHEQARAEIGWREIHVRSRPDPPITARLTLKDVNRAFADGLAVRGVSYCGARYRIVSGFSFKTDDGLQCYGVEETCLVKVLGVVQNAGLRPPARSADSLAQIAREFDLDLIFWCRCVRLSWDDPLFRQLLVGSAAEPGAAPDRDDH